MRKKLIFFLTLVLTFSFVSVSRAQQRFSLRLLGGMGILSPEDINRGIEGWNDFLADLWEVFQEGEVKPINLGYEFGGDLVINLTHNIGIGIGAGYIQGAKTSDQTFSSDYGVDGNITNKPKIRAIPIKVSLFYTLPLNNSVNVVFNGGGGIYFAKYSYNFRIDADGFWMEGDHDTSSTGFGFHGGIGLEFNLAPNIAFLLEGQGRYAKIDGFEGESVYSETDMTSIKEEGVLYYVEGSSMGKTYRIVYIYEEKPSGEGISKVREAKVDFSGFALMAGIRIKF